MTPPADRLAVPAQRTGDSAGPRGRHVADPSRTAPSAGRWSAVAVAGLLAFVVMFDMNIVNMALVDIGRALGAGPNLTPWAMLSYQLPVVALLLPAGRWLDAGGTRAALTVSVAGFALASVAAAVAPSMWWLIAARFGQGTCGTIMFVLTPVLAAQAVGPERSARAMSVPATMGPLGSVSGPAVGGLLLDHFGWRAVFLLHVPLCLITLLIVLAYLPRDGRPQRPDHRTVADVSLIGGAVAAVLLALTFAPGSPVWLALALAAVPATVRWVRSSSGRAVVAMVRASGTASIIAAIIALTTAQNAARYLVPWYAQNGGSVSASKAGLLLVALMLGTAVAAPLGGRLADRVGTRTTAKLGASVFALGLLLLIPTGSELSLGGMAWRLTVAGFGVGLNLGPAQAAVMTATGPAEMVTAGGVVQLARNVGVALGPATAVAVAGTGDSSPAGLRWAFAVAAGIACLAVFLLVTARPVGLLAGGHRIAAPVDGRHRRHQLPQRHRAGSLNRVDRGLPAHRAQDSVRGAPGPRRAGRRPGHSRSTVAVTSARIFEVRPKKPRRHAPVASFPVVVVYRQRVAD